MQMVQMTTLEDVNAQAEIYATLSAIFTQKPNQAVVSNIRNMGEVFSFSFDQYRELNDSVQNGLAELRDYISQIETQPDEAVAQALLVDWTRLFRGLYANYGPKPPYESLWRDQKEDSVEILQQVSQQYRKFGLVPTKGHNDRPDFLGLECDFISYLYQQMAAALASTEEDKAEMYGQALSDFYEQHIALWAADYCDQIVDDAKTGFYRGFLLIASGVFDQGI